MPEPPTSLLATTVEPTEAANESLRPAREPIDNLALPEPVKPR